MLCPFIDLGIIDYDEAYALQKEAVQNVIDAGAERVFLCEHPSVLTLGRMADERFILTPKEELSRRGIRVLPIDRGGEVTLHAPGQLIVYPILNLSQRGRDLHIYIRQLEEVAIEFLNTYAIHAERKPGKTGVWFGNKKIVSLGVGVKKWVTFHGLGININTDLQLFSLIKPCGLDVEMTSIAKIKGQTMDMGEAKKRFCEVFARYF